VDYQILKLQESPEYLPYGEMPRHFQLYCDRDLCEKAVPGNRVTIIGIYSIRKANQLKKESKGGKGAGVGVRPAYIRVVGMQVCFFSLFSFG
jgi:DNA replication licensing factor MCM5